MGRISIALEFKQAFEIAINSIRYRMALMNPITHLHPVLFKLHPRLSGPLT
jgi:hypothetical protein